jgi:hypothetical protein
MEVIGQYQAKVDLPPIKDPSTHSALRNYCNTHPHKKQTYCHRQITKMYKCVNRNVFG